MLQVELLHTSHFLNFETIRLWSGNIPLWIDVTVEHLLVPSVGNYFGVVWFDKTHYMQMLEGAWPQPVRLQCFAAGGKDNTAGFVSSRW